MVDADGVVETEQVAASRESRGELPILVEDQDRELLDAYDSDNGARGHDVGPISADRDGDEAASV